MAGEFSVAADLPTDTVRASGCHLGGADWPFERLAHDPSADVNEFSDRIYSRL